MSHTLIIFAKLPEEVETYVVPNHEITDDMRKLLTLAHGKFINCDIMNDGMKFLNVALCKDTNYASDVPDEIDMTKYASVFAHCKVPLDSGPIEGLTIDHVYSMGFIL